MSDHSLDHMMQHDQNALRNEVINFILKIKRT